MLKVSQNYPLFETSYGNDYPVEQLFINNFDTVPSKIYDGSKKYSNDIMEYLQNNGFTLETEILITPKRNENESNLFVFFNFYSKIIILVRNYKDKKYKYLNELSIYYDIKKGKINSQIDFLKFDSFLINIKKSGINLIKSHMGHLDTEEYEMNISDINLEKNYGKNFVKIHDLIIKRLNTPQDKGIILFHGEPGTGKTSYIKYLTHLITDKEILFIPPAMTESLSDPSIIPFLMDHKNSILIVEDAERVIADRELNGSSMGVSNILNLTDGILGDCLNIQIIATFNMKREKIDPALLRKGRLIVEHKFTKLSVDECNDLLLHLGKNHVVNNEMSLADIYNIDEEIFKTDNKKTSIGFNN